MHLRAPLVAAVAVIMVSAMASLTVGQHAKSADASPLEFKGQVIVLHSKSVPQRGAALEKPELKRIGEREFIVGTAVDHDANSWMAGKLVWLPLDDIAFIAEFKDAESYKQASNGKAF